MNEHAALSDRFDFYCYETGERAPFAMTGYPKSAAGAPMSLRFLATPAFEILECPPLSMWDYADFLPVAGPECVVSLEEGATPLVDAAHLAERFGFDQVLLKNEMVNPTGSFKDRQVSVGISHARELGKDTVAVVSSGNVACAAAAYAARAGMRAILLMHGQAGGGKAAQAASYGATAVRVDEPSAARVFELCLEACAAFGWYHLSTAGLYEPFNVEGAKTIAYELYHQTEGELPDWIVAPVGGGGLLGGVWRGFLDLQRMGVIERMPRMCGVQASGCAPFVKAIEQDTPFLETLEHPWPDPKTIAGGIADDIIFDGHTALPAVRQTGGTAVAVNDEEIMDGLLLLARTEGLLCEPTCAVVIAALAHLQETAGGARVCCLLTGNGVKDIATVSRHVAEPKTIPAEMEELRRIAEGAA